MQLSVSAEGKQSDSSCSLDSEIDFTLMLCACSGYTAGQNLASFGNETTQCSNVFIINGVYVIHAALADLSSRSSYSISSNHAFYILQNQCISERNIFILGRCTKLSKVSSRLAALSGWSIVISAVSAVITVSTETAVVSAEIVISAETAAERITLGLLPIGRTAGRAQWNGNDIGNDFCYISLCAVLRIVGTTGNTSFHKYAAAFFQLISNSFCQGTPGNNINPVCKLALFTLGGRVVTAYCYRKRCYGTAGLRGTNNRIPSKISQDLN